MSGTSSVGQGQVYEAGDQRNYKDSEINERDRYKEGKEHSHISNDSSPLARTARSPRRAKTKFSPEDQRSIANKLASAEKVIPNVQYSCSVHADLLISTTTNQSHRAKRLRNTRKIQRFQYVTLTLLLASWSPESANLFTRLFKARNHGNEPSKGAKIDAEIQQEEEEMLKKKGAWGSKQ